MKNETFCKNDSSYYGELVDDIRQIVTTTFTGIELKEYVEHHVRELSKDDSVKTDWLIEYKPTGEMFKIHKKHEFEVLDTIMLRNDGDISNYLICEQRFD